MTVSCVHNSTSKKRAFWFSLVDARCCCGCPMQATFRTFGDARQRVLESPIQDMSRSLRRHWKSSKPSARFDPGWCTLLECTSQKNSVLPALPCASRKERVRLLNLAKGFCKSL